MLTGGGGASGHSNARRRHNRRRLRKSGEWGRSLETTPSSLSSLHLLLLSSHTDYTQCDTCWDSVSRLEAGSLSLSLSLTPTLTTLRFVARVMTTHDVSKTERETT